MCLLTHGCMTADEGVFDSQDTLVFQLVSQCQAGTLHNYNQVPAPATAVATAVIMCDSSETLPAALAGPHCCVLQQGFSLSNITATLEMDTCEEPSCLCAGSCPRTGTWHL